MDRSIKPFLFSLLALISGLACRKDTHSNSTDLLGSPTDKTIKVNQQIILYDSTTLTDSGLYLHPPANRLYKWTITPADDQAVFTGPYRQGRAEIVLNRSGTYQVQADIYDSLGQHQLGHTNEATIRVTTDTLYQFQALQPDDQLIAYLGTNWAIAPDTSVLPIYFTTTKTYDYASPYTGFIISGVGYSLNFADSVELNSFPLAYGYGVTAPVGEQLFFEITNGAPMPLSITWLNKTWSGSVMVSNSGVLSYTWNDSTAVKLRPNQ
jgi:hypothetical protein